MAYLDEIKSEANGHLNRHFEKLDAIEERLAEIVGGTDVEVEAARRIERRETGIVAAGATTIQINFDPVPAGAYWLLKTLAVTGNAAGPCAIYLDSVAPENLLYRIIDAQLWTPEGAIELFVQERRRLIFNFTAQVAGQLCTANFQAIEFVQPATHSAIRGGAG